MRTRTEHGSFLIHGLSNSQKVQIKTIQLKAIKTALGLRTSTPANIVTGGGQIPPLEIRFRSLVRSFVSRIFTNEDHPLSNTLEEVIEWKVNTMSTDRIGTAPLIEAFRDIVPKEHLIGIASLLLCFKTTFTSGMSRPNVEIDRGVKLAASSEPTPLLFVNFCEEELKQTRSRSDGSTATERPPLGVFLLRLP
jgi:hypothetical protein